MIIKKNEIGKYKKDYNILYQSNPVSRLQSGNWNKLISLNEFSVECTHTTKSRYNSKFKYSNWIKTYGLDYCIIESNINFFEKNK